MNEGIASIAGSKLKDLAQGLILKPRPLIVLHNPLTDETVQFKLKRGLINHQLFLDDGSKDKVIFKNPSALIVLMKAITEARKWIPKGYLEV